MLLVDKTCRGDFTSSTNLINDAFVCVKIQSEPAVVLLYDQARVALHGLCADTLEVGLGERRVKGCCV